MLAANPVDRPLALHAQRKNSSVKKNGLYALTGCCKSASPVSNFCKFRETDKC
jgi:hypothetical protein